MSPSSLAAHSPAPLYSQLRETLRGHILDGSYRPHDRLPSESELISAFGVSRVTVRQALNDLVKEGLIFKIAGKGSYVSKSRPLQNLSRLQGFGEAMSLMGYETVNQLLGLATTQASAEVASRLQVKEGDSVIEIRRLRHLDHEPVSLEQTYVRPALGERLAREDLAGRDIYRILENDYGIALGHAELCMDALAADEELAHLLRVAPASPVLHIERLSCAKDGTPLEFSYVYYRGDSFRYRVRVERD